jgi:hypothetical protein
MEFFTNALQIDPRTPFTGRAVGAAGSGDGPPLPKPLHAEINPIALT